MNRTVFPAVTISCFPSRQKHWTSEQAIVSGTPPHTEGWVISKFTSLTVISQYSFHIPEVKRGYRIRITYNRLSLTSLHSISKEPLRQMWSVIGKQLFHIYVKCIFCLCPYLHLFSLNIGLWKTQVFSLNFIRLPWHFTPTSSLFFTVTTEPIISSPRRTHFVSLYE